jgi:putative ABC transport system permease protein
MLQDIRYAYRNLKRSPLFTSIALLSLALGIGANSAIFTIADQVLLRLLPVRHARELLYFTSPGPQSGQIWGSNRFSYPMFQDLRDHNLVFSEVAARFDTPLNLSYKNRSEQVAAEIVSGSYFDTLGLSTAIGRGLTPDDDRVPGGHSVVVLTYDYWKSRLGADPSILNQVLLLNGHPMTVIGVAAPGYRGFDVGQRVDVLVPAMMKAQMTPTWNGLDNRRVIWLQLVGRLRPGVTVQQAEASLQPYYHALLEMEARDIPFRFARSRKEFVSKPLKFEAAGRGISDFRDEFKQPLRILVGIVGLLLLIACANLANLLLARAAGRQKEIALRLAMGASRFRLVRQLVVESLVLSLAGAALGLVCAAWTVEGLLGILSNADSLGITGSLDWRVFAFTLAVALVTGVLFGLVPAWQATSPRLAHTLKVQPVNVSPGSGHVRLRKVLVVSQFALSLLLLIAATLFTRSLHNLRNVDLGFRRESLLAFDLDPALNAYSPERIRQFAGTIQERIAGIPGVRAAAIGVNPLVGDDINMRTVHVEGYQPREDEDMNPRSDSVSPGYFATLGIPLRMGREFNEADRFGAPQVAVVNEAFAKYFFPRENPLGRRFGFGRDKGYPVEIVGVVANSKYSRVEEKTARMVYLPFAQEETPGSMVVYARAAGDPKALFPGISRVVRQLDAVLPVNRLRTMEEQVDSSLSAERLIATRSGFFAALATILAAIGLYGVMAYTVTRRTREIGIRLALGAGRSSVLRLVMRDVAILTAAGVAVALPAAVGLSRLLRSELFGVGPNDPLSIAAALVALLAVALLAGYIPAERAARVNPNVALRYE